MDFNCTCPESLQRWHELSFQYLAWYRSLPVALIDHTEEQAKEDIRRIREMDAAFDEQPLHIRQKYGRCLLMARVWNEVKAEWRKRADSLHTVPHALRGQR